MAQVEFRKLANLACKGDLIKFRDNFEQTDLSLHYGYGTAKDTLSHVAARNGHVTILQYLKEKCGLTYLQLENADGKNCLHEAAQHGHSECLSYLLGLGFNVDSLKRADWTPLMLACTKSNLEIVEILVDKGANLTLVNKDGWTCFHIACREGNETIVSYLLNKNQQLANTISKNGRTPLHTVGGTLHGRLGVMEMLLQSGHFSGNEIDSCGTTPIMDTLRNGHTECAKILLKFNKLINLSQEDKTGKQAIHLAAEAGQVKSLKFLHFHNISTDILTTTGNTPLHLSAREGHIEAAEYLINAGAKIYASDPKGRTSLIFAADGRRKEMVEYLKSRILEI